MKLERHEELELQKHTFAYAYTKKIIPSGLRVIVKKTSSPLVAINFWVPAGVKNEEPEKNGLSHFFEHMVFKGTANYPGSFLSRRVQALGGIMNAGTSLDTT
ncbi:MAG TPA: insulinase family protein, partial [Candidatus Atribacteria bacterium]|nr:insulinase family protein [Candidatus Atribacteria bacterium]